jgi:hypothetical protein
LLYLEDHPEQGRSPRACEMKHIKKEKVHFLVEHSQLILLSIVEHSQHVVFTVVVYIYGGLSAN